MFTNHFLSVYKRQTTGCSIFIAEREFKSVSRFEYNPVAHNGLMRCLHPVVCHLESKIGIIKDILSF
jgi:hypothetical protein